MDSRKDMKNNMFKKITNLINGNLQKIFSGAKLHNKNGEVTKSVYSDFTPKDNIKKGKECLGALEWALNNSKITNVALTGTYGAGKSSVISTYLSQHPKCNAVNISMATFDGYTLEKIVEFKEKEGNNTEVQEYANKLQDELERGILKQLFYKVNSDKIPLSRYRKLHDISLFRYILFVLALCVIITAVMYLAMPTKIIEFTSNYFINGLSSAKKLIVSVISLIITVVGAAYAIRMVTTRFRIKEISVGDTTVQGETESTESILNKNMDEILYFFERTKYDVVFIEDLDRFNDMSIFIKLREINGILNNYDAIKRRIVFVYAVKDDLFSNETERTKFFDFVIPVIPVINTTNSGEIMRDLLGLGNKQEEYREYPEHNITPRFITLVSPYIGDMRVLLSTVNEFWIYRRTLKDAQDVRLNDENMFALMIYKNLYPKDFALLEAESGDVKSAFLHKKIAVNGLQTELNIKRNQLECKEKDSLKSIKELKIIILSEMIDHNGVIARIELAGESFVYPYLLGDDFSFNRLKNGSFIIYYRLYNEQYENSIRINNLMESKVEMKELFNRYDAQCVFHNRNHEEILLELENNVKAIADLRANTLQQLIERYSIDSVLPESVRQNDLLVFLLRHGYINESYADYINYFHPGSITKDELNFILSIRNFRSVENFSYPIEHCGNVCDRLEDYEFEQKETLNFYILDFLLENRKSNPKLARLIKQITNRSVHSQNFIKAYIERDKNIEQFFKLLCHDSTFIWEDFEHDEQLSTETKDRYLKFMLIYCELEDIVSNNYSIEEDAVGGIKKYIEQDRSILLKMAEVPATHIKNVISMLDIHFYELNVSGLDSVIMDFIFDEKHYILNQHMMKNIFIIKDPDRIESLFDSNYHHICELDYDPLLEYVYEDFPKYIREFVLGVESNTEETTEDVEDIIERLFNEERELCIPVIEKEHQAYWKDLRLCLHCCEDKEKKEVWEYLLKYRRTDISWDNYIEYLNLYGLTSVLVEYANENMRTLIENESEEYPTDDMIKNLFIENISDDSFNALISSYQVDQFTNNFSEFQLSKLEILIDSHYFEFTAARYAELKEISSNLSSRFALVNKDNFIELLTECNIGIEEVKEYIKHDVFIENDIISILKCISVDEIDEEMAIQIRGFEFDLPKEYVIAAWDKLKEQKRYQLLYNQMNTFTLDELADRFNELGGVYKQFAERTRHKYTLYADEFNKKLCKKLCQKDFLSSCDESVAEVGFDPVTSQKKMEKRIVGYVRKKSSN